MLILICGYSGSCNCAFEAPLEGKNYFSTSCFLYYLLVVVVVVVIAVVVVVAVIEVVVVVVVVIVVIVEAPIIAPSIN